MRMRRIWRSENFLLSMNLCFLGTLESNSALKCIRNIYKLCPVFRLNDR